MLTPEELGNLMARLVMAEPEFADLLLSMAARNKDALLPADLPKLVSWCRFVSIARFSFSEIEDKGQQDMHCPLESLPATAGPQSRQYRYKIKVKKSTPGNVWKAPRPPRACRWPGQRRGSRWR